jgi:hypothetical protein
MEASDVAKPATALGGEPAPNFEQLGDPLDNVDTHPTANPQQSPDATRGLAFHPLAEIFPLIEGAEFDDLVDDIRAHGVHEPIWLYQGKVLDGRNRYRASVIADADCPLREYMGDDPVAFVISLNLKRRHLDESQRAMVAAKLANMPNGGDRSAQHRANLHSAAQAADMLNVSERSVKTAKGLLQDSVAPELRAAVEQGNVSVSAAADVATKPKEEQREIVARGKKEVRKTAKAIRADKTERKRKRREASRLRHRQELEAQQRREDEEALHRANALLNLLGANTVRTFIDGLGQHQWQVLEELNELLADTKAPTGTDNAAPSEERGA